MYVEGTFSGDIQRKRDDCPAVGPKGYFVCTRDKGHEGVHRAGMSNSRWAAEWDDDRSTDDEDADTYWQSIGL